MRESDHRTPLMEKVLRPGDPDLRNQLETDSLGELIRPIGFEMHKHFRIGRLVVEVKACHSWVDENIAPLLANLRASRIEQSLLINLVICPDPQP